MRPETRCVHATPGITEEDTITDLIEEQLEDIDIVETVTVIDFEVGDSVVYPHHGAGTVIRKEQKEILGESREYLTIKILHNDMTVMVPTANAAVAGLRRVIDEETVQKVLGVLQDECSEMPKNWNRRFKHNRDKIKTGDIYELAEVVRNLGTREAEKGLSTGEKQMFTRARKILASELMYALEMDEDQVDQHIHDLIVAATKTAKPTKAKSASSTAADDAALSEDENEDDDDQDANGLVDVENLELAGDDDGSVAVAAG
jgi:CarD family transcriptional regulator